MPKWVDAKSVEAMRGISLAHVAEEMSVLHASIQNQIYAVYAPTHKELPRLHYQLEGTFCQPSVDSFLWASLSSSVG